MRVKKQNKQKNKIKTNVFKKLLKIEQKQLNLSLLKMKRGFSFVFVYLIDFRQRTAFDDELCRDQTDDG